MQVLDVVLSFLALLSLAVFYTRRGLSSALAPLASLCTAVLFLLLCGLGGFLVFGGWVFLAAALALGVFAVLKGDKKTLLHALASPGFLFFLVAGALALGLFALKQPVLSHWDEFSFWGTAVKLMKLSGGLYPMAPAGWFWTTTELPALPLLGWFVQVLGGVFAPWKVYFAYSLLYFTCFSALAAPFRKKKAVAFGLLLCGLLLPFFFLSPMRITALSPAYLTAYGDLPAGVLMGGALAFYLSQRRGKEGPRAGLAASPFWALLPLAVLALVKDNTLPLALVAAGLMAADSLFFAPAGPGKKAGWAKAGFVAGCFAAPLAAYLVWKRYAAFANAQNAVTAGEATGASPLAAAGESLSQLAGLRPRGEALSRSMSEMAAAFADKTLHPVSMAGSALATMLLVLLVLALAVLLGQNRRARLRAGLWAGLLAAGFAGFQFVLLTYFAFLNKYEGGLPDFARYSASYFAAWLMLALFLLALCSLREQAAPASVAAAAPVAGGAVLDAEPPPAAAAEDAPPPGAAGQPSPVSKTEAPLPQSPPGRTRRALLAQSLVLCLAAGAAALFSFTVLPGYSVLDYPARLYAPLREEEARAAALAGQMEEGTRAFYVGQGDSGLGWFRTHYYLQPHILDYSFGGGSIRPEATGESGEIVLSAAELEEYLAENGCVYIYVNALDESFIDAYGGLFTDGLAAFDGEAVLYERTPGGRYAPVAA